MQRLNWFPWSSNEELRHPPGARSGGGARVGQYLGWTASGGLPGEVFGARPAWRPPGRAAGITFSILSWKALESPGGGGRAFLQELLPQQPG